MNDNTKVMCVQIVDIFLSREIAGVDKLCKIDNVRVEQNVKQTSRSTSVEQPCEKNDFRQKEEPVQGIGLLRVMRKKIGSRHKQNNRFPKPHR